MKKYLWIALIASVGIYFLSSFLLPVWGEGIVVPVMIICILAAVISAVWLIVILIRQTLKKK